MMRSVYISSQMGSAMLLAMVVVTIVSVLTSAALWSQWKDVGIEQIRAKQVRAAIVMQGGMDLALSLVREDSSKIGGDRDYHFSIAGFDVKERLGADHQVAGSGDMVSVSIKDVNSCINIRNVSKSMIVDELAVIVTAPPEYGGLSYIKHELDMIYFEKIRAAIEKSGGDALLLDKIGLEIVGGTNYSGDDLVLFTMNGDEVIDKLVGATSKDLKESLCYANKPTQININVAPVKALKILLGDEIAGSLAVRRSNKKIEDLKQIEELFKHFDRSELLRYFTVASNTFLIKVDVVVDGFKRSEEFMLSINDHLDNS